MTRLLILFIAFFSSCQSSNQLMGQEPSPISEDLETPFEKEENYTATYKEAIDHYYKLEIAYQSIQVNEFGMTDSGHPLHEVIVTNDGVFDLEKIRENGKVVVFINNAIHAGEPCGVDASMMLARDLRKKRNKLLEHAVLVIIPIYNISGHKNRGSHSRANQQGPQAYGFRGNAQNLDLNRDFIKGDSENAKSFNQLYTKWNPDIFIDNHTSNGADYPYVMTLIPTQKDKMEESLSSYMQEKMLPELFEKMQSKGYEMTPYVYARTTPDEGIMGFLDLARYSSGYASLHNSISFMPETHMLKPFKDRVMSTYHFMRSMLEHVEENHVGILNARKHAVYATKTKSNFDISWTLDQEKVEKLLFKGYEAKYKPSKVSGLDRLYYDHDAPYEKEILFYNTYKSILTVEKPEAYIIPRAYKQIVDKMESNGVEVSVLENNKIEKVELYEISNYKSPSKPYEGHFLHTGVEVEKTTQSVQYYKGDYIIKTDQKMNKYIVQTLEPQGPDSWFAWNFFDGILMQKEHFSPYVFEDLAEKFLMENPDVKRALEAKKAGDPEFAKDSYAQLNFVYKRSPHYELTYMRYPVGRVLKEN